MRYTSERAFKHRNAKAERPSDHREKIRHTAREKELMRHYAPFQVVFAISLALILLCAADTARGADVLYVTAAHLIIDASKPAVSPGALVITDGVVTAAGSAVTPVAGARRLDLGDLTLMPSLIDAHTHLAGGAPIPQPGRPQPLASPAYAALRAQHSVERALSLGVSAMRVLGTSDFLDVAIQQAVDDGTIPGPHILPAAHPLSIAGGHDDFSPLPYTMQIEGLYTPLHGYVGSAADAEQAAQLQIKYGARVIKLMASGGVGSPLDSPLDANLTFEEMRAAVEQAHMHHMKAAAHAENLQSVMDAMRAGVDSIEHGSELDQQAVDYMKSHNVVYVPTVHVGLTLASAARGAPGTPGSSAYSQFKAGRLTEQHLKAFTLALKNGVTMAAGSDNGYPPTSTGVFAELVTDVEHGMSVQQALESATLHGAALLGFSQLGTLASGMEGDFIAVEGNPLADIHALERVRVVVFKGRIVTDTRSARPQ
jgi:imidazolonepropionase-like amidohydrolase